MKYCSGAFVDWKHGSPQTWIIYLCKIGIRYAIEDYFKYSLVEPPLSRSADKCTDAHSYYDGVLRFANLQEHVLTGGHGLMVNGYDPVIKALARDLDIHLNHRYAQQHILMIQ